MKKLQLIITALLLIAVLGCKPSFNISQKNYQDYPFLVATADNGYSLEMNTVYDALYKSKILNLGGVLDTARVRGFIDSLVLDSMMGFEASEVNLSDYYSQYRMFKLRYYDILLRLYLKKMVYDKAESDSLEIVDYYYANEDKFAIEEQIDLYHIAITKNTLLFGPDSLRYRKFSKVDLEDALFKFADSIKSLITSPDKFPEIAKQFTEDEVAARTGGYLGWTKKGVHPYPFDSIAFELRAGDIAEPYRDNNGWHIIMANEYYPAGLPELNENLYIAAKTTLQTVKTNEIGNKLIDSLLSDFDVQLNPEIVDGNIYVIKGRTWGAIINGIDTIDCNEARSLELTFREKYQVDNTTAEMKEAMFRQIGERYVLVQAGRAIGIEKDSALTDQREKLNHKYARTVVSKQMVDAQWAPSDSMIEDYYNSHTADFEVLKPLKVQHIIVEDSVFGEFLRDQAMSGIDFMQLAKEHYPGEESIREDLANLGYIGENDVSKEFYNAALMTRIGEVSHPVKTEFGYHLIKVLEIAKEQTLDEAKRTIIPILKKEHKENVFKNFKDRLFTKYHVQSKGTLYPVHLKPKSLRK